MNCRTCRTTPQANLKLNYKRICSAVYINGSHKRGVQIYTYVATTSTEYSQNTHDPKDPNKIKQKEERKKKVIDTKAADYGGLKPKIKKAC